MSVAWKNLVKREKKKKPEHLEYYKKDGKKFVIVNCPKKSAKISFNFYKKKPKLTNFFAKLIKCQKL